MKKYIYFVVNIIFNLFPINKRKIFFLSYYGSQYGCNPKYLSEYIIKNCKFENTSSVFSMPIVVPAQDGNDKFDFTFASCEFAKGTKFEANLEDRKWYNEEGYEYWNGESHRWEWVATIDEVPENADYHPQRKYEYVEFDNYNVFIGFDECKRMYERSFERLQIAYDREVSKNGSLSARIYEVCAERDSLKGQVRDYERVRRAIGPEQADRILEAAYQQEQVEKEQKWGARSKIRVGAR